MTEESPIKTYLVKTSREELQIDIPENWKVTYGPISPGKGSYGGYALRIYESDTKQRAIFTDVTSFRDLSIPVRRLVKAEKGTASWERDESGSSEVAATIIDKAWVDDNGKLD